MHANHKLYIECTDFVLKDACGNHFLPIKGQRVWVMPPRATDGIIVKKKGAVEKRS